MQLLEELGTGIVQQYKPDSAVAPEQRVPVSTVSVWAPSEIALRASFLEFPAKLLVWEQINYRKAEQE